MEIYEIMKLRVQVFVVEQNCPYMELDDYDQNGLHVYYKNEEGIQAYIRILDKGVKSEHVSIGRVIAVKRRSGLGSKILQEGLKLAKAQLGADTVYLEAQTYAREFYKKHGFRQVSEQFLEDGIPHIKMIAEV